MGETSAQTIRKLVKGTEQPQIRQKHTLALAGRSLPLVNDMIEYHMSQVQLMLETGGYEKIFRCDGQTPSYFVSKKWVSRIFNSTIYNWEIAYTDIPAF
eukprot:scaffold59225_cov61-Cyclotella_meneghiniana.AAC.2